jgi:hypothetical protein
MSILFPLSVFIFHWREVKNLISFQFAWINFIIALGMAVLLAETRSTAHVNFWWGPMIGLFLLFYCSLEHWINKIIGGNQRIFKLQPKDLAILIIYSLHLICGILYFIKVFLNNDFSVVR